MKTLNKVSKNNEKILDNINTKNEIFENFFNNFQVSNDLIKYINKNKKIDLENWKKLFDIKNEYIKESLVSGLTKILRDKKLNDIGLNEDIFKKYILTLNKNQTNIFFIQWGWTTSNLKLNKNELNYLISQSPETFVKETLNRSVSILKNNISFELDNSFFEEFYKKYTGVFLNHLTNLYQDKGIVYYYSKEKDNILNEVIKIDSDIKKETLIEIFDKYIPQGKTFEFFNEKEDDFKRFLSRENIQLSNKSIKLLVDGKSYYFYNIMQEVYERNAINIDFNININQEMLNNISNFLEGKINDSQKNGSYLNDAFHGYDLYKNGLINKDLYIKILNNIDYDCFERTIINTKNDALHFLLDENIYNNTNFFKDLYENKKDFYLQYILNQFFLGEDYSFYLKKIYIEQSRANYHSIDDKNKEKEYKKVFAYEKLFKTIFDEKNIENRNKLVDIFLKFIETNLVINDKINKELLNNLNGMNFQEFYDNLDDTNKEKVKVLNESIFIYKKNTSKKGDGGLIKKGVLPKFK